MNKVLITGRLTADADLRQTQSGVAVVKFTVAVNRPYQKDKEKQEADFISCVAWRSTAEFISRYFFKGDPIEIVGSLRTGKYQDKNYSDVTHYTTDVFVDEVLFTQSKKEKSNSSSGSVSNTVDIDFGDLSEFEEIGEEDIPF